MEFMGIKGDRPEGAADGQFCTRRKCRRLRCGVLAAVLAAGLCLGGCQGKNVGLKPLWTATQLQIPARVQAV